VKYLNTNKTKKGSSNTSHIHASVASQFFFDLKTLRREKNSANNCRDVGLINSPFSFSHPYEGVLNMVSINANTLLFNLLFASKGNIIFYMDVFGAVRVR